MTKAKIVLVLAFLIVCAAGAVVGMALDRHTHPARGGPLRELKLSPDQQRQMKAIWSDVVKLRDQVSHQRRQLEQQRQEAIRALLSEEQKARYDQILQQSEQQSNQLEEQVHQAVRAAEQRTRQILTPQQLVKFDEMQKKFGSPRHFRHDRRHPSSAPATTVAP